MTSAKYPASKDVVARPSYTHAGPAIRKRNWITAKAREDPPCLGPCPYCVESVLKRGGKYLDLVDGAFVPHRHQPRKLDGTGAEESAFNARPPGEKEASDSP